VIADGVHRALHQAYNIPVDDRFQRAHQYDPEDLIYDSNHLGIQRSHDIGIVHCVAGNWRDTTTKKALYKRVVELLSEIQVSGVKMYRLSSQGMIATTGPSATASHPK